MAYRLVTSLQLGITGITDLRAQLLDSTGANSGGVISSGFTADLGGGQYLWDYSSFPDGFYGAVTFYRASAPGTRWIHAINPQEAENSDQKSSLSAPAATALSTAQWTNVRASLLDYLDAAVSSRLASGAYTAPDNATISSIQADTNDLQAQIGTAGAGLTALPGMVWANSVRSLTTFGTLVADIWSYATRTLTSGGGGGATANEVAVAVWSYVFRTLTSTAAETTAAISGSNLTITRAVTFSATVTGVSFPATWSKVYFTVKESNSHPDTQAFVQIVRYNGSGNDGLIRLNKGAATAAQGSLTANSTAGTIAINLTDDATVQLYAGNYTYDLKFILSDSTSQIITYGSCYVVLTSTEAIA